MKSLISQAGNHLGGMPSAVGNYVNFLRVGTVLIVPSYGLAEDGKAREILERYFPNCSVNALDCRDLAGLEASLTV